MLHRIEIVIMYCLFCSKLITINKRQKNLDIVGLSTVEVSLYWQYILVSLYSILKQCIFIPCTAAAADALQESHCSGDTSRPT